MRQNDLNLFTSSSPRVRRTVFGIKMLLLLTLQGSACGGPMQSLERPDLVASGMHLTPQTDATNYKLCFIGQDELVVRNQGRRDAATYQVVLGLTEPGSSSAAGACAYAVANGTRAGMTTRLNPPGQCCAIPMGKLKKNTPYLAFLEVDPQHQVDDANRGNNRLEQPPATPIAQAQAPRFAYIEPEEVQFLGTWRDNFSGVALAQPGTHVADPAPAAEAEPAVRAPHIPVPPPPSVRVQVTLTVPDSADDGADDLASDRPAAIPPAAQDGEI